MNNLKYVINSNGDAVFYFCSIKGSIGFNYWEDFLILVDVINNCIKPEEIHYSGITDIFGHFVIDGLRVDIECTSMLGVIFTISKNQINNIVFNDIYDVLNLIWKEAIKVKESKK